ncbi:MAG TPA: lipopolysaccharide kinase InaA family protein [Candidatus Binatia bacterium]|nr:lipopolysaccharide kinase InaA family protein [Candidatus Binatia bacterium]
MAEGEPVRWGGWRAWVATGIRLTEAIAPCGDPDVLLTRPDCRLVKFQRKVTVGRVTTAAGPLYVKRYSVFAWRVALASIGRLSPAARAWQAAAALAARGFATPEVVAALECRRAGVLRRSFLITREVTDAVTADRRWADVLAMPPGAPRREARRALARALGALFGRLHAAGVYHGDLKDVNVLVRGSASAPACVLLDLERVRLGPVSHRRRVKNLMQLERTLGRRASRTDRLRALAAYVGQDGDRRARRGWARAVLRAAAAKDRGKTRGPEPTVPPISCIVVCQDEEAQIAACLESVAWCDRIILVDGGSKDRTLEIARRFTSDVIRHPWPGYRAQKQFALEQARTEWVFNIDADERVTPELAREIRESLARVPAGVAGFAIPRIVPYLGRWWYRGGWYPRPVVRLVRRAATRWGGVDPHERAEVAGPIRLLEHPLVHHTYANVADHLRAVDKLTAVAVAQVPSGRTAGGARLLVEPGWRFLRAYVARRACLEGLPGLFVALTDAFYTFLRFALLRERARGGAPPAC